MVHHRVKSGLSDVRIRDAVELDATHMARLHLRAFPTFFLTFLGERFLREFYRATVADPSGIAFVAEIDEELVGFVVGTIQPAGFFRRLARRRWLPFALACVPAAVARPSIISRLFRALRRSEESSHLEQSGAATLLSIAVEPAVQSGGLGKSLVEAFCQKCWVAQIPSVSLTTDALSNERVNGFYRRLGFGLARRFLTPEGREMNEYRLSRPIP